MNAQFKKGVLELIVLESVRGRDMYGYELVEEVSHVVDVNEGTIYPLLKRLTNEHYFETYLRESTEGPPRKYYHITAAGVLYRDRLEAEWSEFSGRVNSFLQSAAGVRREAQPPDGAEGVAGRREGQQLLFWPGADAGRPGGREQAERRGRNRMEGREEQG